MFFRKKWALVLSGGGARGMAHVGVLKYLDELKVKPGLIVGTSVGAIIGSFYSCGMSGNEIEDFILNKFDYRDYFEIKTLRLPDNPFTKALQAGETIKNLFTRPGVDSGGRLYAKILEMTKDKNFGQEKIPFLCNSVDIVNHEHFVHRSGKIADAVKASFSVPGFFSPCRFNSRMLVDGGVFDNMPVKIAREEGFSTVVAVNLNDYEPMDIEKIKYGIDVIVEALFVNSRIKKRQGINRPDVEIVATDKRGSEDFSEAEALVDLGYRCAAEKDKDIRKAVMPLIRFK